MEKMRLISKRAIWVIGGLLLFATGIRAQKNHFIYIQSENNRPFYAKIDDKLFSSSDAGYLIIPRLAEGSYNLSLGFPKDEWPRQNVTCVIKEGDAGYQLKNFGDKGWGILNLQTMQVTLAKQEAQVMQGYASEMATDSFSIILASVVNDKGILKKRDIITDTTRVIVGKPRISREKDQVIPTQEKDTQLITMASVKKIGEEQVEGGVNIRFLDISQDRADTVSIFIPVTEKRAEKTDSIAVQGSGDGQVKKIPADTKDTRFLDMELPNPNLKQDSIINAGLDSVQVNKTQPAGLKCKQVATEKDFLSLRKQMAAETNDLGMISVALKRFRATCFSTEQIRNLGSLFLNEEGKYKLYVAAFPFVSDLPEYGSLEKELKDEYYITRFRAMLHK